MEPEPEERTRFTVNGPQVIHQTIDDEVVIVNLATGTYYSVTGSGAAIWELIERGHDRDEIIDRFLARFDADRTTAEQAIDRFISGLLDESLVAPAVGREPPEEGSPNGHGHRAFEPPLLEKFDDLQDLILLDPVHEVLEEEGWPHARSAGAD